MEPILWAIRGSQQRGVTTPGSKICVEIISLTLKACHFGLKQVAGMTTPPVTSLTVKEAAGYHFVTTNISIYRYETYQPLHRLNCHYQR